ncbi:MAG: hypothetical protein IPM42_02990 [Saprospiraceae bacterium]|nr:hypothetical protein [Saprospiraceae bacterium]
MMEQIIDFIGKNYPYLLGGIGGATLTIVYTRWTNRIKEMHCCYVDDDVITKIPVLSETGEQHKNIYTKEFCLKNTTGKDISSFKIIFEFDADAKIIKQDSFCKTGRNDIKPRNKKPNECSYLIKNFNRGDEFKFFFDIANVTNDHYNITEADCLGFKIVVKDQRKPTIKNKSKVVTKDKIN